MQPLSDGLPLPFMPRDERLIQVVEEIIRTFPGGAPTIAILDRLEAAGFRATEIHAALDTLRDARRVGIERGRWVARP